MGTSHSGPSAAAAPAPAATSTPPSALTMLMGMLGQNNQAPQQSQTSLTPGTPPPQTNPFTKLFPATPSTQDLSVGASPPGSVMATGLVDSASAKPTTMANLSNVLFGHDRNSALQSASSLAGK